MEESHLNCLPSDIKLNIFSRLQTELVLDCKRVCRDWRDLIRLHANTLYFANLHLQRQHGHGLIHQEPHQPSDDDAPDSATMSFVSCFDEQDLYYAEYYGGNEMNSRKEYFKTRRISHKFLAGVVELVGSCNGLICLSTKRKYTSDESLYVCNPIIGEIVSLPGVCMNNKKYTVHGFGYHPITNEYKVLKISYDESPYLGKPPYKGRVEVYTLGTGSGWRNKGEITYCLLPNINSGSVCVNGALHWLHYASEDHIVAFDLADEEFHLLQTPRDPEPFTRALRIFRGCLVLVNEYIEPGRWPWHLWFLKTNSSHNTKQLYTKEDPCWSKEWTIPVRYMNRTPHLFAVLEGDQVLIMDIFDHVFRYDIESQIAHNIWETHTDCQIWAVPIPHGNSFVSLKALGENNVETIREEGELKSPNSRNPTTSEI